LKIFSAALGALVETLQLLLEIGYTGFRLVSKLIC